MKVSVQKHSVSDMGSSRTLSHLVLDSLFLSVLTVFGVCVASAQQIVFTGFRDGNPEIYVVGGDGSAPTNLTHHPAYDTNPHWSPDGTKIAFQSDRDGFSKILVMNADGSSLTDLVADSFAAGTRPRWSPDGTKILYTRYGNGTEIFVMNPDGSSKTNLSNTLGAHFEPEWSPDGSKIVFQSTRDGNEEIYVMNADGTGQLRLTTHPDRDFNPQWSPDGKKIGWRTDRDGNEEIYTMNADGSSPTNLSNSPGYDVQMQWSPDGSRIAFQSTRRFSSEIFVMNADGSFPMTTGAQGALPRWSEDGGKIAFVGLNGDIYAMNPDGTDLTDLTNGISAGFYDFQLFGSFGSSGVSRPPVISEGGIVNAASFEDSHARQGIYSIFGDFDVTGPVQAATLPLPTSLGGIQVLEHGVPVPLFYVSRSQINAQHGDATGEVTVVVIDSAANRSNEEVVTIAPTSRIGLLTYAGYQELQHAAAINETAPNQGQLIGTGKPYGVPAAPGGIATLYYIGGVPTAGEGTIPGQPTPNNPGNLNHIPVEVFVNNTPLAPEDLLFSGLSPGSVGLGQATIRLPLKTGIHDIRISTGESSSNTVQIAIAPPGATTIFYAFANTDPADQTPFEGYMADAHGLPIAMLEPNRSGLNLATAQREPLDPSESTLIVFDGKGIAFNYVSDAPPLEDGMELADPIARIPIIEWPEAQFVFDPTAGGEDRDFPELKIFTPGAGTMNNLQLMLSRFDEPGPVQFSHWAQPINSGSTPMLVYFDTGEAMKSVLIPHVTDLNGLARVIFDHTTDDPRETGMSGIVVIETDADSYAGRYGGVEYAFDYTVRADGFPIVTRVVKSAEIHRNLDTDALVGVFLHEIMHHYHQHWPVSETFHPIMGVADPRIDQIVTEKEKLATWYLHNMPNATRFRDYDWTLGTIEESIAHREERRQAAPYQPWQLSQQTLRLVAYDDPGERYSPYVVAIAQVEYSCGNHDELVVIPRDEFYAKRLYNIPRSLNYNRRITFVPNN